MENTIGVRIADFLKSFPPFQLLDKEALIHLAAQVVVRYCQSGEIIFQSGETLHAYIYILRDGAVQLYDNKDGENVLVESCDEGDLFGIQPFINEEPYLLTAVATEESLIYGLPVKLLTPIAAQHPKFAFYLVNSYATTSLHRHLIQPAEKQEDMLLVEIQSMEQRRAPVTCTPAHTIREAAVIMTQEEVSSILIINALQHPIGIVTDKDLRKKVATGKVSLESPITQIMSSPVITISPDLTVADVQIQMVKHKIHHLCITEDGTNQSPVRGVLTEHDLLVVQANNPAVLIRTIRRSNTSADLRRIREKSEILLQKYIEQEVSIAYISTIITAINDALVKRAIELSEAELQQQGFAKPDGTYCWLSLGSAGREEQLLRTDQDNALIFADTAQNQYETVKTYFLHVASKVTGLLHECGFEYCPADMMASNPRWCLSLQEWKAQFSEWIRMPTQQAILYSTIFFDYRPVFGEAKLAAELTEHIFQELATQSAFLSFLAKNALQNPPPLTFFRSFMVERSGEHKDEFDIKSRAMMPLCDAARVLTLEARIGKVNNTFQRFEKLAGLDPSHRELYEQAADAYELLLRFRTLEGLKNKDSGRFFKPSDLSKMQRILLRNSFQPIQELQTLLSVRFQLAFLR